MDFLIHKVALYSLYTQRQLMLTPHIFFPFLLALVIQEVSTFLLGYVLMENLRSHLLFIRASP